MITETKGFEHLPFAQKSHDLRLNYAGSFFLYPVRKSKHFTIEDSRKLTVVLDDVKTLNDQRDYFTNSQNRRTQYDNPIYYVLDLLGFNEDSGDQFSLERSNVGSGYYTSMRLTIRRKGTDYPSLSVNYSFSTPDRLEVNYYHHYDKYIVSQSRSYVELERDLQEISQTFSDRGEVIPFDFTKGDETDAEYLKNSVRLRAVPKEEIEAIDKENDTGYRLNLETMTLDLHGHIVCDIDKSDLGFNRSGEPFTSSGPFQARNARIGIRDVDAFFEKVSGFKEQSAFIAEKGLQVFMETILKQQGVNLSRLIIPGFEDDDMASPRYEFTNPQYVYDKADQTGRFGYTGRLGFKVSRNDRTIRYFNKWKSEGVPSELLTVEDVKTAIRDFKATGERVGHPLGYLKSQKSE